MKKFLLLLLAVTALAAEAPFDWNRAKEIHARAARGEAISTDERAILDEAIRRHNAGEPIPGDQPMPAATTARPAMHFVPLTELKEKYQNQDGGLYGGGQNEPPAAQATLADQAIAQIRPLDAEGKPAADGKIVLLALGMSNTTMEFSAFVKKANAEPRKAPNVVVVDGAQGGKDATAWATADAPPWKIAEERLRAAHVTPQQVQVMWIKQALIRPQKGFPLEAERLRDRLRENVTLAREKYPNLRVAYLSSRIYAGYAGTNLNPEPYAYESAFAVRWLIQEQVKGSPTLNTDPTQGTVKAPVLLWGPYLWADGRNPRQSDGLTYEPTDFAGDGTHPAETAREKVANLLLTFFTTDSHAKSWFTGQR